MTLVVDGFGYEASLFLSSQIVRLESGPDFHDVEDVGEEDAQGEACDEDENLFDRV